MEWTAVQRRLPGWVQDAHVPRRIQFALAWSAVAVGIGLYKGINLLLLVGYAFPLLVACNARAAARNMPKLAVRRRLLGPLFAGARSEVELQVHNVDERSGMELELKEGGADHAFCWQVPALPAGASVVLRAELVLPRRGRYPVSSLEAGSGYPFGLVECRRSMLPAGEWIVLPRLGTLHRPSFRRYLRASTGGTDRSRTNLRRHRAARDELHSLRPFRTGDSPRAIHWRTSARCNELMIRQYEDFTGENLILIFDPSVPAGGQDDARSFEAALSLGATVAWEWCSRRGDRFALIDLGPRPALLEGVTSPDLGGRVLERLALAAPTLDGGAPDLDGMGLAAPPPGPVVLVGVQAAVRAGAVGAALRRPITVLDLAGDACREFYEPPAPLEG